MKKALQEYAKTGRLTVLLPYARRKFAYAFEDPRYIQLRQAPGGPAECVMYLHPDETPAGMQRDAAGVVVVSSAKSWEALLA